MCLSSAGGTAAAEDRSIDGMNNNLLNPSWGSAGAPFRRVTTVAYGDGASTPAGACRPSPRLISNTVIAQRAMLPNAAGRSDYVWAWGQFLDHEMILTPEADPAEPFDIVVPPGDPVFDPAATGEARIPVNRSVYDPMTGTGLDNPRQQRSVVTAWIDGSVVYGSDGVRAGWLRAGFGGRLKVTARAAGDLLPFNDGSMENFGGSGTDLFVGGDIRANEQPALTAMQTLFLREHNRLAGRIAGAHPDWTDERIYQRARKLVGAEMQVITYKEFLPALLGDGALGPYTGYKPSMDPSVLNIFPTAAFRVGHSTLSPTILRLDADYEEIPEGHLSLREAFFNVSAITEAGGIEPILRGLVCQVHQEIDVHVIDDVRNLLFIPGIGGLDLPSLNIQRGRDHGLPDYNQVREDFGLPRVTSFADISSDPGVRASLECVYGCVDNIDPWVGMLAEDHRPGAGVGELMYTIIKRHFEALRDGDRFWYANDPDLSPDDIEFLEGLGLRDVIELNTDVSGLPENVFYLIPEPALLPLCLAGLALLRRRRKLRLGGVPPR